MPFPEGGGGGGGGGATVLAAPGALVKSSGGDYATVKAAYDAGERLIYLEGTVTETANLSIAANTRIVGLGAAPSWVLGAYTVGISSNVTLKVEGGVDVRFGNANTIEDQSGKYWQVGGRLLDLSTSGTANFIHDTSARLDEVDLAVGTRNNAIIYAAASGVVIELNGCDLTGGDAGAETPLSISGSALLYAEGLVVSCLMATGLTLTPAAGSYCKGLTLDTNTGNTATNTLSLTLYALSLVQQESVTLSDCEVFGLYSEVTSSFVNMGANVHIFGGNINAAVTLEAADTGCACYSVEFGYTTSVAAGCGARFYNCGWTTSLQSALSVTSGAEALFEGCDFSGLFSLPSDVTSIIRNSTNPSDDNGVVLPPVLGDEGLTWDHVWKGSQRSGATLPDQVGAVDLTVVGTLGTNYRDSPIGFDRGYPDDLGGAGLLFEAGTGGMASYNGGGTGFLGSGAWTILMSVLRPIHYTSIGLSYLVVIGDGGAGSGADRISLLTSGGVIGLFHGGSGTQVLRPQSLDSRGQLILAYDGVDELAAWWNGVKFESLSIGVVDYSPYDFFQFLPSVGLDSVLVEVAVAVGEFPTDEQVLAINNKQRGAFYPV